MKKTAIPFSHQATTSIPTTQHLTPREKEVVFLLLTGKCRKEIARSLNVTENTICQHLKHIYKKVGVSSKGQAIVFFLRHESVHPKRILMGSE